MNNLIVFDKNLGISLADGVVISLSSCVRIENSRSLNTMVWPNVVVPVNSCVSDMHKLLDECTVFLSIPLALSDPLSATVFLSDVLVGHLHLGIARTETLVESVRGVL